MQTYAILKNSIVTHIVLWDGDTSQWGGSPPFEFVLSDGSVKVGDIYSNGAFASPPPVTSLVPASVSPLQMRRALRHLGLKPTVDAFLKTVDEETLEAWDYATQIDRDNTLIATAAAGLGMTAEQVDDLFRLAATL